MTEQTPDEQDATVTIEDPDTGERKKVEGDREPESNDGDVEVKDE